MLKPMLKQRNLLFAFPALAIAASLSLSQAMPALAAPAVAPGEVITLKGTDHMWVVDAQGIAHLAGDTRALASQSLTGNVVEATTVADLLATPRGAPLLTADLVKIGDSIYLPQYSTDGSAPILLHIQSPQDLALVGVTDSNYSQYVLDSATWAQRYGIAPETLPADEFRFYPAPADADDSGMRVSDDGGVSAPAS